MARQSFRPEQNRNKVASLDTEQYPDSVSVDLDAKDPNDYEIIVEDDTPEADRGRPTELDEFTAGLDDDAEELRNPGQVEKRIKRLKYETNTERRAREAAERERDAAVELARSQSAELEDLRKRSSSGATALAASMKAEREAKLADAKRRYAQANTDGDSEAMATAVSDISQAQAELIAIAQRTPRPQAEGERRTAPAQQQQDPVAPNVRAWISHNSDWFQKPGHEARTNKALSIHYDLVGAGINPASEAYTRELDKRMKAVYSNHKPFGNLPDDDDGRQPQREARRTNVQAEGGRENDRVDTGRKVTLSASQVAIAKRLGVPVQAYAEQLLKQRQRDKGVGA